jgi:hypothetical protein
MGFESASLAAPYSASVQYAVTGVYRVDFYSIPLTAMQAGRYSPLVTPFMRGGQGKENHTMLSRRYGRVSRRNNSACRTV